MKITPLQALKCSEGGNESREPGRTRTCDRLLRRQMLYPAELRVQTHMVRRRSCREDRTRTCDPLVPNQMRYHLRHFPNINITSLRGKTGTRTQGTLSRPQLSRLLHYHSATFPLGCANLAVKSIWPRVGCEFISRKIEIIILPSQNDY